MMWGRKTDKELKGKNSPITETTDTSKETKKPLKVKLPTVKFGFLRNIVSVIDGKIFTSELITKNIPFIFFMIFLATLYIANNYKVQSKVREIETITKDLKDLREEHISIKSNLMYRTKKSEVANQLKSKGIKEATKPPYKITIKKEDN